MSCIRLAYVATVFCLFQSVKATWEGNLTNTTNATNEVLKVVQLPYPEFEKLVDNDKAMELQKKISTVRAALKEIRRARVTLSRKYASQMEKANKEYEKKLEEVKDDFSGIKGKMDKARSTEKIEDTKQKIKDMRTQIELSKAKLRSTMAEVKNVTAERAKGKKLCQDLAVTAPFDNKYPHAILSQEKSLITSLRSYLTKLHYGSNLHDATRNDLEAPPTSLLDAVDNFTAHHYVGLPEDHKNKDVEDEVLKEMGLVRDDLVYTDQERLNQKIDKSDPIRRGVLHKKVINALNRAESLLKKTAPLYTLSEDQKIISRCFQKWDNILQASKAKNAEATSELDENKDSLAALILDLKDLKAEREKSLEVALLTPAYHNGLWKSGTESLVISNAYNFVAKQYHWSYKSAKRVLRREEKILENKLKSYVRKLDQDAGVAETCMTSKVPLGGKIGGTTDPDQDWKIQCDDGLTMKALWIPSGGERSLEDMKCCKLPTDGYVNAFKCKAEKIENEDREAICSSGVVVGIHAEKRSRAPDSIKCCNLVGSSINKDKCHRIAIGGNDASGGPTKSIDVWRGECLHNTIMAGLFLNQDHDIIGAKCCETISKV